LFSGISDKSRADIERIWLYIRTYNQMINDVQRLSGVWDEEAGMMVHGERGDALLPISEILFSGGDPLTLPNLTLARYLATMAESGLRTIRFGTKEVIFNPSRFDDHFFAILDLFHETYPDVRLEIVGHYTHPFELVNAETDDSGNYLYDINQTYAVRDDLIEPLRQLNARRSWLGHFNQFPIIAGVNDSVPVLRLLMFLTNRLGITLHNIYACREIIGNKHFRRKNCIATQYDLVNRAKAGLSGLENHGRLIMSTELGKIEVVGVAEGKIHARVNRFIHGSMPKETFVTVDTDQLHDGRFYWLTREVIDGPALGEGSRQVIHELEVADTSFVREVKTSAAKYVEEAMPLRGKFHPQAESWGKTATQSNTATIKVVTKTQASQYDVDLSKEIPGVTLAKVLARHGVVEAACEYSMSCSTCVGICTASVNLPDATEDEDDLIDAVLRSASHQSDNENQLRATCQIRLQPGESYVFTVTEGAHQSKHDR